MPRQQQQRRHRTIPHQQETPNYSYSTTLSSATPLPTLLRHKVMSRQLDYGSLGIILPILITTVASVLFFLNFVIPSLLAVTIWIEEGLYTLFDIAAAVFGGYVFGV